MILRDIQSKFLPFRGILLLFQVYYLCPEDRVLCRGDNALLCTMTELFSTTRYGKSVFQVREGLCKSILYPDDSNINNRNVLSPHKELFVVWFIVIQSVYGPSY
jgi:hypothetical protein